MNHGFDYLIERKRLRNQLLSWKISLVICVAALITYISYGYNSSSESLGKKYIAYYAVEGMITDERERDLILKELAEDKNAAALILYVNSPGGTVVGAERMYYLLRSIANSRPVVAVMGTAATSGGYLVSLAADHIIAHHGTITGSIGVIMQTAEVVELAQKIGVTFHNFKSGALKAAPNPTEKLTSEVEISTMSTINDINNFFVNLVAERRNLGQEYVNSLADGRIYTGTQALANKLVDAIGTTEDAITWLHENKKIDKNLTVVDINKKHAPTFLEMLISEFAGKASNAVRNMLMTISQGVLYS